MSPALQQLFDEENEMPVVRMRPSAPKTSDLSNGVQNESAKPQKTRGPQPKQNNKWETVGSEQKGKKKASQKSTSEKKY